MTITVSSSIHRWQRGKEHGGERGLSRGATPPTSQNNPINTHFLSLGPQSLKKIENFVEEEYLMFFLSPPRDPHPPRLIKS